MPTYGILQLFDNYHNENDKDMIITAPNEIKLTKSQTVIGRGSPKFPVDIILIGRKDNKDIISRRHAEIQLTDNNDYIIKDLGAINGIFVNEIKIKEKILEQDDIIQFGGISNISYGSLLKETDSCIKYKFHLIESNKKPNKKKDIIKSVEKQNSPFFERLDKLKRKFDTAIILSNDHKLSNSIINETNLINNEIQLTSLSSMNTIPLIKKIKDNNIEESTNNNIHILNNKIYDLQILIQSKNNEIKNIETKHNDIINHINLENNEKYLNMKQELKNEYKLLNNQLEINLKTKYESNYNMINNLLNKEILNHNQLKEIIKSNEIIINKLKSDNNILIQQNSDLQQSIIIEINKYEDIKEQLNSIEKEFKEQIIYKANNNNNLININNNNNNNNEIQIDNYTLTSSLTCLLCDKLLLDSVILQCSHGFCKACIELYWHQKNSNNNKLINNNNKLINNNNNNNIDCTCPKCNINLTKISQKPKNSNSYHSYYHRSDHLDNLIWILIETYPQLYKTDFSERTEKHRKSLLDIGINPDELLVLGGDSDDIEHYNSNSSNNNIKLDNNNTNNNNRDNHQVKSNMKSIEKNNNIHHNHILYPKTLKNNDEKKKSFIEKDSIIIIYCEYCGGKGHIEKNCPHRMYEMKDSDTTSNSSDNDDDIEEE